MSDDNLESVLNFAKDAMGLSNPERKTVMSIFANHIRESMTSYTQKKGWNVICGRNFGAMVCPYFCAANQYFTGLVH